MPGDVDDQGQNQQYDEGEQKYVGEDIRQCDGRVPVCALNGKQDIVYMLSNLRPIQEWLDGFL